MNEDTRIPDSPWMAEFRRKMERRMWIAMRHGQDTPAFFEEVQREGVSIEDDDEKIRNLKETRDLIAPRPDGSFITSRMNSRGNGEVELTIEFDARAHKEAGINAAIASLGDRTGDDPIDISKDLKKALRKRDLGLDKETRLQIASSISEGEEVIVGVSSTQEPQNGS